MFYGELTILSGTNSSGKTSWLNELVLNVIQQDLSVALYSGEMNATVLKSNLQTIAAGKSVLMKASKGDYWFVPDTAAQKYFAEWNRGHASVWGRGLLIWRCIFYENHVCIQHPQPQEGTPGACA